MHFQIIYVPDPMSMAVQHIGVQTYRDMPHAVVTDRREKLHTRRKPFIE